MRTDYQREWVRADYQKNPTKYCKIASARYHLAKALFLRQLGGKCGLCGYNRNPRILQFDHITPVMRNSKKRVGGFLNVACAKGLRNPAVWDELHTNIQLLCPNCHAEKTQEQITKHA